MTRPRRRSKPFRFALAAAFGSLIAIASTAQATVAPRSPSKYPARATRPSFQVSPRQLARAATGKTPSKKKARKKVLHGDPARALLAFQAMQKQYYVLGSGLYEGEPFSYLWPFSQALAATVSMANVPALKTTMRRELKARLVGLRNYLDADNSGEPEGTFTSTLAAFDGTVAPPTGPGGTKYYDDNDWVGIELMRAYRLTHESAVLADAEAIMAFEMAGWQSSPELGCPGGLPFSNAAENTDRNTITTAPAAELALQIYKVTGDAQYLQFAQQAYQWVRTCLLEPNGMYGDHVNAAGAVEPRLWSYTQGVMIGAGALLYKATGDSEYLTQARQTADASLTYFTPTRLGAEIPFFPSVYFRNLLYLDSITHDPPGAKIAQTYVDYAWQHLRLGNDLFVAGTPRSGQLLVQAAIVQIYALLSSSPSTYF
jgi:Glycosyl hydrolase family 76